MWLIRTREAQPTADDAYQQVQAEQATSTVTDQGEPNPDQRAIRAYQASTEAGAPLSERKLAEKFGKSRRWARKIITHVREHPPCTDNETRHELHSPTP